MKKSDLVELASVRKDSVIIGGKTVTVREIGLQEFTEYGEKAKADKVGAAAMLIAACVIDENDQPIFSSADEAMVIAKVMRVSLPIINKVMELSDLGKEKEGSEKHPVAD